MKQFSWPRPWVIACLAGAAVLLAAALPVLWQWTTGAPAAAPAPPTGGAPWQVQSGPQGTRVFELALPGSVLAHLESRFGSDLQLAVVERRGRADALEAFVERHDAAGVIGKLVFELEVDASRLAAWRERSPRQQRVAADTVRHELAAGDRDAARSVALSGIVFLPQARVDAETLRARFGEPALRQPAGDNGERWHYPALGLLLLHDAQGVVVLHYVPPADFGRRFSRP